MSNSVKSKANLEKRKNNERIKTIRKHSYWGRVCSRLATLVYCHTRILDIDYYGGMIKLRRNGIIYRIKSTWSDKSIIRFSMKRRGYGKDKKIICMTIYRKQGRKELEESVIYTLDYICEGECIVIESMLDSISIEVSKKIALQEIEREEKVEMETEAKFRFQEQLDAEAEVCSL